MGKLIAVDFDDVMFPFNQQIIAKIGLETGQDLNHAELHVHGAHDPVNVGSYDVQAAIENLVRNHSMDILPLEGAKEALEGIGQDHKLIVMTARPRGARKATEAWLEKQLPGVFDEVYLLGNVYEKDLDYVQTKAEKCVELGVDLLIDDFPKFAQDVVEIGTPVLLFGNYDWNRHIHDEFPHAYRWDDVPNLVQDVLV